MAANIHISLSAEPIFNLGSFVITNSMFTGVIVSSLIIITAFAINRSLKPTNKPTGLQNFGEMLVEAFFQFCYMITNDMKKARLFLPFIATFFLFILLNNWSGLIPGVGSIMVPIPEPPQHETVTSTTPTFGVVQAADTDSSNDTHSESNSTDENHYQDSQEAHAEEKSEHHAVMTPIFRANTADLNTTIALGLLTIVFVQMFGFMHLQLGYLGKFFNFSSPIMFFVGLLEIISEFAKIISFAFRLFGNVFAGEVLIAVLLYITKVVIPIPFYGLELFVGMMQALVFSMLSLVFYNMATQSHAEHEH